LTNNSPTLIENNSQLIKYFNDGIKENNQLRIGVEHEKFLFNKKDLKRINYEKIKKVFELLSDHPFLVSNPENARKMAEFRIFSLKKFK